jgi:hypothetical protein
MSAWGRRKVKKPELEPMETITVNDPNVYYDYNDGPIEATKSRVVPDKPHKEPTKVITPESNPMNDKETIDKFNLKTLPMKRIQGTQSMDVDIDDDVPVVEPTKSGIRDAYRNPTEPLPDSPPGEPKIYGRKTNRVFTVKDPE